VPMMLAEDGRKFNAAILLDRQGKVAGSTARYISR